MMALDTLAPCATLLGSRALPLLALDPRRVLALAGLHVLDTLTTVVGLGAGMTEGGPLAAGVVAGAGFAGLVTFGLAALALQLIVLATIPARFERVAWELVLVLGAFPVIHNVLALAA